MLTSALSSLLLCCPCLPAAPVFFLRFLRFFFISFRCGAAVELCSVSLSSSLNSLSDNDCWNYKSKKWNVRDKLTHKKNCIYLASIGLTDCIVNDKWKTTEQFHTKSYRFTSNVFLFELNPTAPMSKSASETSCSHTSNSLSPCNFFSTRDDIFFYIIFVNFTLPRNCFDSRTTKPVNSIKIYWRNPQITHKMKSRKMKSQFTFFLLQIICSIVSKKQKFLFNTNFWQMWMKNTMKNILVFASFSMFANTRWPFRFTRKYAQRKERTRKMEKIENSADQKGKNTRKISMCSCDVENAECSMLETLVFVRQVNVYVNENMRRWQFAKQNCQPTSVFSNWPKSLE